MIPGLESIRNQILSVFQNLMIPAKIDFCTVILESILGTGIDSKIRYFVMAMISVPIPEKKGFITPLTGTEKLLIYCRKLFISANPIGLQYVCAYWLRLIMRVAVKVATEESKWFEFWLVCSSAKFLDCHARSREHFSLRVQALRCVRPTATVHDIKSI